LAKRQSSTAPAKAALSRPYFLRRSLSLGRLGWLAFSYATMDIKPTRPFMRDGESLQPRSP
jgi:hypothetical protein